MGMGKKTQLTAIAAGVAATLAAIAAVSIKPDIRKTTRRYAQKDGTNLYLDRYETERRVHHRRPVIIFIYGGGFHKGRRDNREYVDFFHFLARKGYVVAAIDYRKGLRDLPPEKRKSTLAFLGALNDAIYMAVDDLTDATKYIIDHADEWGIDTKNIILCGSKRRSHHCPANRVCHLQQPSGSSRQIARRLQLCRNTVVCRRTVGQAPAGVEEKAVPDNAFPR